MNYYFKGILIVACILLGMQPLSAQQQSALKNLKREFENPPAEAWPKTYWWWLNGNIDTVRIKEEIRSMKSAGLSGFDIFEIGAPKSDTIISTGEISFMGDDFMRAVKVALTEAEKLNMKVGLNLASSWNAGGAWVTPEYAAKSIYYSKTSYGGKKVKLPFPKLVRTKQKDKIQLKEDQEELEIERNKNGKPVFYRDIAVLAVPKRTGDQTIDPDEIVDVTQFFDPKTESLDWNQTGEYDIYRYVCSNSGEFLKIPSKNSNGLIIDHFDARATAFHFNYIIDRLKTVLGDDISKSSLKSLYLASYEALGNVWTESLPEKFSALHGYDITPYLPVLFDEGLLPSKTTERVLRDFRVTLSELMIDNFYRKAKEIANAHGLKINSEAGGPGFPLHNVPVEPLKSLGVMDLPRGEFWINHSRLNEDGIDILRVVKEVSAASHIYGKGVVEQEAFTTFQHWQEGPFEMKPMGDRAFCEGMNKVVVHGSSHNPRGMGNPGLVYFAGTHYNDKRVWWPKIKPFNQYLARISNVLQKTDFAADVLYFYGSAVPNFTGHKNSRFFVGAGYDYEVVNAEILKRLTVDGGLLKLPTGAKFKMLVLENEKEIDPEIVSKLTQLVADGAKVISERPDNIMVKGGTSESLVSDNDLDKLWFDMKGSASGPLTIKGKVLSGVTPLEMLEALEIAPDFEYADDAYNILDFVHYKKQDSDYYFIRNTTDRWVSRQCSFRQVGKSPELWDPVSGAVNAIPIYSQSDKAISLPLSLPPYGSAFVVFSDKEAKNDELHLNYDGLNPPLLTYSKNGILLLEEGNFEFMEGDRTKVVSNRIKQQALQGAWEVFFPEGKGAPNRIILPELLPWSESEIEGVRYFSGIAKYVKTFPFGINSSMVDAPRIFLDLGSLSNIGDVWLNGEHLGVSWTKPHRFDITDIVKAGDNLLEIEVANTWSNRLKGDAVTGKKFTHTNVTHTDIHGLNKIDVPWKDVPLLKSGLMGPVKIITLQPIP